MRWPASPTTDLLVVFGVVFAVQQFGGVVGLGLGWFALALPLAVAPWTLVTSVYAHATLNHLITNALALALVGYALERFTSRIRFHAFVLVIGAISGIAELTVGVLVGGPTAVIGASGAILGLYGYALSGNPLAGGILARLELDRRTKLALLVMVAAGLTLLTARSGVALVAHATGLSMGLIAGRRHLLRVG